MFNRIMVPVDLAHAARLEKALDLSAEMAKHFKIPVTYVGVTAATPGPLGHNPEEYSARLDAFVSEQAEKRGVEADGKALVSHDPATDVDDVLLKAVHEVGADLVIMSTHIPGLADYIIPSNGGKIAAHSDASVFLVRE